MRFMIIDGVRTELSDSEYEELLETLAPPAPSISDYEQAIQRHIDDTAKGKSYSNGALCASYVSSTKPEWAAQAVAFVAWRDEVWTHAYAELARVQAGQREQPSVTQIVDELPPIVWPVAPPNP